MNNSLLFVIGAVVLLIIICIVGLVIFGIVSVFKDIVQGFRNIKDEEDAEKALWQQLAEFMRSAPKIPAHLVHIEDLGGYRRSVSGHPDFATANLYVTLENGAQHKVETAMHLTKVPRVGDTVQLVFYPERNIYLYADCPASWLDSYLRRLSHTSQPQTGY